MRIWFFITLISIAMEWICNLGSFEHMKKIHFRLVTTFGVLLMPAIALAEDPSFASPDGGACKFVGNIQLILNLISVSVVTIAIIFAGYQIAFAHKRIADVAPVLIGGVLIGAAGQIAKMLVTNNTGSCNTVSSIISQFMSFIA